MVEAAGSSDNVLDAEEARLARAAANGDGEAFATLYERYAQRAYNLALRLGGSAEDAAAAVRSALAGTVLRPPAQEGGESPFRARLFAETRQAAHERMRGEPPLRAVAIETANDRLPERQREALALRELERLAYEEIATTMELDREAAARLIAAARIDLRDGLRGTSLTSVSAASPRCERALGLLAMREDGELGPGSAEATMLVSHLAGCSTCSLAGEAMREASAAYRAWPPAAVPTTLFDETMARAAELVGSDWTEVAASRTGSLAGGAPPGLPSPYRAPAEPPRRPSRHPRRAVLVATLAALGLGAVVAVVSAGQGGMTPTAPSGPAPAVGQATVVAEPAEQDAAEGESAEPSAEAVVEPAPPVEAPEPSPATTAVEAEPESTGTGSESPGAANGGGGVAATEPVPEPQAELEPTPVPAESAEPDPEG